MRRVGFVGLGTMGAPMAGHLVTAGNPVVVWNRTKSKSQPLYDKGARVAESLEELASLCPVVCLCVNRSEDVDWCVSTMCKTASPNSLFIDHSTISPHAAALIAEEIHLYDQRFMDAPVTGGSVGAQNGTLTIFCGGDSGDFAEAEPILRAYGKTVAHVGPHGAGQKTKMANQIAVGGALIAMCESLAFAKKAGLDLAQTLSLISKGAAGSWAMDNYGPKVLAGDWSPGFSIKNQRKDFGYCMEAAEDCGAATPCTELVDTLLEEMEKQGHGEWATAALYEQILAMGFKA
jgi:3-hydroxyisobutyrate dehydrogenase